MQADAPGAAPELSYAVKYEVFAGTEYNIDFRGRGRLVIQSAGPGYVFSGSKRQTFSPDEKIAMQFGVDDIWNVAVSGRTIRFNTRVGRAGRKGKPFLFFCRDAEEAATVAALLPSRKDADFIAAQDFTARLNSMPGVANPWTSVTNIIIAVNVVVFVIMAGLLGAGWFQVTDIMPYMRYGANNGAATTDGEWWRLVTSMFLHFGLLHLVLNMWALFQAGHFVEKLLGRRLYALAYFGSGIISSLASILWHGDRMWSAGASGAIFGVYGALLGYMLHEKRGMPRSVFQPMFKSTLAFAGYNLLYGLVHPGIDNAAHIGGFLGGIVIGWLVAMPVDLELRAKLTSQRLRRGLVAVAVLITAGVILTPRFEYRLKDELAWAEVNKEPVEKERGLLQRQQAALHEFQSGKKAEDLARLLTGELIPFYENWGKQITALHLTPGLRTDRRREALNKIFAMRIESYRHLVNGIRNHAANALTVYWKENSQVLKEIARLSDSR